MATADGLVVPANGEAHETVTRLIARARSLEDRCAGLERTNAQLENALTSRIAIEQAKGVLGERLGLELDVAFEVLRRAARHHRRSLHELAAEVAGSRTTPVEIEASLASCSMQPLSA